MVDPVFFSTLIDMAEGRAEDHRFAKMRHCVRVWSEHGICRIRPVVGTQCVASILGFNERYTMTRSPSVKRMFCTFSSAIVFVESSGNHRDLCSGVGLGFEENAGNMRA